MATALVALGSNIGNRAATLDRAVALLESTPGIQLVTTSRWHATRPIGGPAGQGEFLNGAARLITSLSPEALLGRLHEIERELGRVRDVHWDARTLDLDLLLYDDLVIDTPDLRLPHPGLAFRRFVLGPAVEVAADFFHPQIGWTLGFLLGYLQRHPNYVAIGGRPQSGKTTLAKQLAERFDARLILRDVVSARGAALGPDSPDPIELEVQRVKSVFGDLLPDPPAASDEEMAAFFRQWQALDAEHWLEPQRLTVSDFWFDQFRWTEPNIMASDAVSTAYREEKQLEEERSGGRTERPKLLLLLEPAGKSRIGLPAGVPTVEIRTPNAMARFAEAAAAIEAMQ